MNKEKEWLLRDKYQGIESPDFFADVARLEKGEPLAYVIGFVPFLGCHIDLSFRPLIPRTETEYWVEHAIKILEERFGKDEPLCFLDIFSGSGCVGIALLDRFPNATADFSDIDENALKQIKKNLEINKINHSRYQIFKSDVFDSISTEKKYDAIFANPPYIAPKDSERIQESVLLYEPHIALFSGVTGLELIKKTLIGIPDFLAPKGLFFLEHDDIQKQAIEDIANTMNMPLVFKKDQFGLYRWFEYTHPY